MLGITPDTSGLRRYRVQDVPLAGAPGDRLVLEDHPPEVFERAQPGQLDLHAGRLCLVDTTSGRRVGTFALDEDSASNTLTDLALATVHGPVAELQLIAASV